VRAVATPVASLRSLRAPLRPALEHRATRPRSAPTRAETLSRARGARLTREERLARFIEDLVRAGAVVREVGRDELHEREKKERRERWERIRDEAPSPVVPRKR